MKTVYDTLDLPAQTFKQPPEVVRLQICEESGKMATNFCPKVINEVFNIKFRPTEQCDLHTKPQMKQNKIDLFF